SRSREPPVRRECPRGEKPGDRRDRRLDARSVPRPDADAARRRTLSEETMSIQTDRRNRLARERGIVKPQKLAHVVRRTTRFDELVKWYCAVLGAEVVHSDGMLAFLTYDDEHHRIAIATIPGLEEKPPMAAGTDHIAFTYGDLGDLLYTYRRLAA